MTIYYFDGTKERCESIEFSTDGKRIIVNGCAVREIVTVLRIRDKGSVCYESVISREVRA